MTQDETDSNPTKICFCGDDYGHFLVDRYEINQHIDKIKREHVLEVLNYFSKNLAEKKPKSTKYDLIDDDGKRYPPKETLRRACRLATGSILWYNLYGGEMTNKRFKKLGFKIGSKP